MCVYLIFILILSKKKHKAPLMEVYNKTCRNDEVFIASLPPGFRFIPTDEELVSEYLRKKVLNIPLPLNKIKEVNIYAHSPEQLSAMEGGEKTMYFFSSRERKYAGGSRPDRTARDGFWKASGKGKRIVNNSGVSIGCKTSLVYYRGTQRHGCHDKTNWLMHEYTLPQQDSKPKPSFGDNKLLDKWVLCRVYHSGKADQEQKLAQHIGIADPTQGSASQSQNETSLICYQSQSPELVPDFMDSFIDDSFIDDDSFKWACEGQTEEPIPLTPSDHDNSASFGSHPP